MLLFDRDSIKAAKARRRGALSDMSFSFIRELTNIAAFENYDGEAAMITCMIMGRDSSASCVFHEDGIFPVLIKNPHVEELLTLATSNREERIIRIFDEMAMTLKGVMPSLSEKIQALRLFEHE